MVQNGQKLVRIGLASPTLAPKNSIFLPQIGTIGTIGMSGRVVKHAWCCDVVVLVLVWAWIWEINRAAIVHVGGQQAFAIGVVWRLFMCAKRSPRGIRELRAVARNAASGPDVHRRTVCPGPEFEEMSMLLRFSTAVSLLIHFCPEIHQRIVAFFTSSPRE